MCYGPLIKLLEWTGMLHLTIYSVLTLMYVIKNTLVSIALAYINQQLIDFLLSLFGLFVSCFLYVQALACLTATDRMQSMMDKITRCIPLPWYQRVKGMQRNQRVYLLFGHVLQITYSNMFKNLYYQEIVKGNNLAIRFSKAVN